MSIELAWDTITQGPDGEALAETIRAFIDDRFQRVTLPRMIRSVKVHSFDFGSVPPQIELKDVCDPLPDFYEGDEDYEDGDDDSNGGADDDSGDDELHGPNNGQRESVGNPQQSSHHHHHHHQSNEPMTAPPPAHHHYPDAQTRFASVRKQTESPILSRAPTPGILGGTSNLGYFHLPLSAGLSGTTTPLAAVAGAQFHPNARHGSSRLAESTDFSGHAATPPTGSASSSHAAFAAATAAHHRTTSFGSQTPSSTTTPSSRPASRHQMDWPEDSFIGGDGANSPPPPRQAGGASSPQDSPDEQQERSAEDVQIVFHVSYSGDVKLSLTAEILLDYPMPSFVGIPLQLNITGLTFDGVGILAYVKRNKAHFCFLCPEDANALVGPSMTGEHDEQPQEEQHVHVPKRRLGALLEEIKVESEIGQRDGGKQVLKNVGKVEKFVLEQVRRIFDDEFVYPSFWTFLV